MAEKGNRFRTVSLSRCFNSPATLTRAEGGPQWHELAAGQAEHMPRGRIACWGIPFALGPEELSKKGMIGLGEGQEATVSLRAKATHVCMLHFCNPMGGPASGGEHLADYRLQFEDGMEHVQPVRRRFEINPLSGAGGYAFAALGMGQPEPAAPEDVASMGWGALQTGVKGRGGGFGAWVYALENPCPEKQIRSITFASRAGEPVGILGVTLYDGPGHPLRHVPRRIYKLIVPTSERALLDDVSIDLDLGTVTRVFAVPGKVDERWLKAVDKGLGKPRPAPKPRREFLFEATGSEGAVVSAKVGRSKAHEIPFGDAFHKGKARSTDGKARIELTHPARTWLHVSVTDRSTGQPTPTRIHFCGPHGEYLPPYGHHDVVNANWFEDYAGDLLLGDMSYAYVPGRFQIDMPVGEIYVEVWKGFEYQPVRKRLNIRPGQRTLDLSIGRVHDLRSDGWVTADTHVHFISPETAWLEGEGEGVNLINLLASQWGRLYTNTADITGALSGSSRGDTLVWVGTENRNHLLGHISMLGTHGDPVFPMCTGGPGEAYLGDPDMTTLTEWAQTCKEREGVVIRPHFPGPVCEEPVYFLLDQLDGAELRHFGGPGSLDQFCFTEWYRYLNCGHRVAAVGGTDKMSAGMPVGGARTYAKLLPGDPFTFENWGKAVRAGRTFTSSGPLIDLTVDGRSMGEEIRMPAGGGTVEVAASAKCLWPMNVLEVVVNGKAVASTQSANGSKSLSLRRKVKLEGSAWIAARCGSTMTVQHCWPIHLGAHTSPVYVVAGSQELFSPSDASYMLTLIDGGLTYLDTLSVRYNEKRHRELKAVFKKARSKLRGKMRTHG